MKNELADALDRIANMRSDIGSGQTKFKLGVTMPTGWCKVCGELKDQDLVYHGQGRSGFMYFPCHHASHHAKGKPDIWYNEVRKEVPAHKLIEESKIG
jgi:hypothetical protein